MKKNFWLSLTAPPHTALEGMASARLANNIYLLGGRSSNKPGGNNSTIFPHVFRYSLETDSYSKLENLPKPLAFHSAASHGNNVFCAGGLTSSTDAQPLDKLYAYDVVGKIWLSKASMQQKRLRFSMQVLGAKLVVCGGGGSVEIYDILSDQWTLMQNAGLEDTIDSMSIVLNGKVYVMGGCKKCSDGIWRPVDKVSCIDVDGGRIDSVTNFPFALNSRHCALLTVPNHLYKPTARQ